MAGWNVLATVPVGLSATNSTDATSTVVTFSDLGVDISGYSSVRWRFVPTSVTASQSVSRGRGHIILGTPQGEGGSGGAVLGIAFGNSSSPSYIFSSKTFPYSVGGMGAFSVTSTPQFSEGLGLGFLGKKYDTTALNIMLIKQYWSSGSTKFTYDIQGTLYLEGKV